MSIWTDLLFLNGYIATPSALAQVAPRGGGDPERESERKRDNADTPVRHDLHPLRVVGQLR